MLPPLELGLRSTIFPPVDLDAFATEPGPASRAGILLTTTGAAEEFTTAPPAWGAFKTRDDPKIVGMELTAGTLRTELPNT